MVSEGEGGRGVVMIYQYIEEDEATQAMAHHTNLEILHLTMDVLEQPDTNR